MPKYKSNVWNELFENQNNRIKQPNEYVYLLRDKLKERFDKQSKILDIGYGVGRHIIYFLRDGFDVEGFDLSKNAKIYTKQRINQLSLNEANLKTFNMHKLPWPYDNGFFQGALSMNVIHHTEYPSFLKIVAEINRILVSGGLFLATFPSKENHKFGKGKRIDKYTYLIDTGAEKGIPHMFFDKGDLEKIFSENFKILRLIKTRAEIPKEDEKFRKKDVLDHWLFFAESN